jgi:hypothetical protein
MCSLIAPKISKRYFQEGFLENYMNLIEDKQVAVQIAVLRTIRAIRLKVEDVLQINKIETYLNSIRNDLSKKQFIREVTPPPHGFIFYL